MQTRATHELDEHFRGSSICPRLVHTLYDHQASDGSLDLIHHCALLPAHFRRKAYNQTSSPRDDGFRGNKEVSSSPAQIIRGSDCHLQMHLPQVGLQ